MRTLAAREKRLAIGAVLQSIACARITTYADARARYQPLTGYVSSTWRTATWDAVEREFWPLLVSLDPAEDRISHVPLPELAAGGLAGEADRPCKMILRGWHDELGSVLTWLTSSGTRELIGARVEIVEYLLERAATPADWTRISASAAPVPLWSGQIDSVDRYGDEIELSLSAALPALRWRVADDLAQNEARDLGLRLPVVLGRAQRVSAISWAVGSQTSLALAALKGQSTIDLTDASGFPLHGAVILGGGDQVTYTGKTGNQLTGVAGLALNHGAGDTAIEQLAGDAIYVLSAEPCSAVTALYVLAPWTRDLVRIQSGFSITLADVLAVPGRAVTTARFTAAQLQSLITLVNSAAVNQQPRRSTDVAINAALPTITDDNANTRQLISGSIFSDGPVDNSFNPFSVGVGINVPIYQDGSVIRGTFTDYSQAPNVFVVQQRVDFSCNFYNATSATVTVRLAAGVEEVVVNVTPGSGLFAAFANMDLSELYTSPDPDVIEFKITTSPAGGQVRLGYIHRDEIFRSQVGVTQQPQVAETGGTEVQIRAAGVGAGLLIAADCDGPVVPPAWITRERFEGVSDYSVSGCTVAADSAVYLEPSASVRIDIAQATPDRTDPHDTPAADANVVALNGTKSTQTTGPAEGAGYGRITSTAAGTEFGVRMTVSPSDNWVGNRIELYVRVPAASFALVAADPPLRLQLRSGGNEANLSYWYLDDQVLLPDVWTLCEIDLDRAPDKTTGAGATLAAVDRYAVLLNRSASGQILDFDRVRVFPQPTAIAQRNAAATLGDWTATGAEYRLRVRCSQPDRIKALEVWITDQVVSGTTAPTAYRKLAIAPQILAEANGWTRLRVLSTAVGAPTVVAVRTVRLVVRTEGIGTVALWFDLLEGADGPGSLYYGAAGTAMLAGPDLIRYALEYLSEPEQLLDVGLADTVGANLGADVYGADLRMLGETWPGVLEQLAASSRSNLHPIEDAAGLRWGLWSAEADGTFSAAVAEVTDWETLTQEAEEDRPPTEFEILYAYHAPVRRGSTIAEDAWQGAVPVRDVAAAARRGPIQARPVTLGAVYDAATALEVAGKMGPARTSPGRLLKALGVPWPESYALTIGDVVSLTLTPELGGGAISARVIGVRRDFDSGAADLTLREVAT